MMQLYRGMTKEWNDIASYDMRQRPLYFFKAKACVLYMEFGTIIEPRASTYKEKMLLDRIDFIFRPNFNIGFDIHIIRHQMTQSSYHLIEHFDRICVKFQQLKVVKLDQYFVWHKSLGSIQIYIITTIIGAFLLLYKLK